MISGTYRDRVVVGTSNLLCIMTLPIGFLAIFEHVGYGTFIAWGRWCRGVGFFIHLGLKLHLDLVSWPGDDDGYDLT